MHNIVASSGSRIVAWARRAVAFGLLLGMALPGLPADYAEDFDDGAAQGWTPVSGSWAVDTNNLHSTAIGPADIAVYGNSIWATGFTYHVKVSNGFTSTGNLVGLAYNYQDTSNYYAVTFAPTGTAYLNKVINGTTTTVATASYSGGGPNVWFDVDVIRSGTSTMVSVNGITVFSNIVQGELGAGKIGAITTWTDGRFDNVSISTTAIAIPGTWEAENFDPGGEGVAYHDNVPGNQGGQYRSGEDVDIFVSNDPSGGAYIVKNFETGEWLNYTISVPTNGNYDIELRVATNVDFPNRAYRLYVDGADVTGQVTLPDTGGWANYQWAGKKTVALTAGTHVLKIASEQQYFSFNQIRMAATGPGSGPVAWSCSFALIPPAVNVCQIRYL